MAKKKITVKFPRLRCPSPKVFKTKGDRRLKKPTTEELNELEKKDE